MDDNQFADSEKCSIFATRSPSGQNPKIKPQIPRFKRFLAKYKSKCYWIAHYGAKNSFSKLFCYKPIAPKGHNSHCEYLSFNYARSPKSKT